MAADVADTPPDYVRERAARALEHLRTQDLDDLDTATFSAVTDLTTFARCVLTDDGAA